MLSPLAGVTDNIFRKIVRKWAPDSLLFTEMINASSLKQGFGNMKIKHLELEKGPVGDSIDYKITVENKGNVTLTGLTISDILTDGNGSALSLNTGPSYSSTTLGSNPGTLKVGEVQTYTDRKSVV